MRLVNLLKLDTKIFYGMHHAWFQETGYAGATLQ